MYMQMPDSDLQRRESATQLGVVSQQYKNMTHAVIANLSLRQLLGHQLDTTERLH